MKRRLSKIYTRAGDTGKTRLGDGQRVAKHDPRIALIGDVDELNSAIGIVLAEDDLPDTIRLILTRVQEELFDLGAELCIMGRKIIESEKIIQLEKDLDAFNEKLPELEEFILPSGTKASAQCHLARSICRRAERSFTFLAETAELNPESLRYLNRLSDLLFVLSRAINQHAHKKEILWRGL